MDRRRLRVAAQTGSVSLSTTVNTSHMKNLSHISIDNVKQPFEANSLSEQKSELIIRPEFSLENKLTLLSPQTSHLMHTALRMKGKKSTVHKALTFMLSPSGSEIAQPVSEENHLFPEEQQNRKLEKEYQEFKYHFDKEISEKDAKSSKVNTKFSITSESPKNSNGQDPDAFKRSEGPTAIKIISRPQTTINSRNTSPRRLKQHFEQVRNRKLDILNSNLRALKNEKVVAAAKNEIHKMSMEAAEEVHKYKFENESTKSDLTSLKQKVTDLEAQNVLLKHDKNVMHKQILELTAKYDQTLRNYEKLEYFTNMYNALKERFPTEDINTILKKYDQMQDYVYNTAKRIDEVEEEKSELKKEANEVRKQLKWKEYSLQNEKLEISHMEQLHRRQLANLELEISSQKNFQKEHQELTKKVFELFVECDDILNVITNFKGHPELNASMDTPIDCLEAIKRSLKLSTTKNMQEFIKKIMISSNLLKRKYFPHALADKFDPEQIYSQCCKHIEALENEIKRLKNKRL